MEHTIKMALWGCTACTGTFMLDLDLVGALEAEEICELSCPYCGSEVEAYHPGGKVS